MSARTIAFGAMLATTYAATIRSRQIVQPHYYCPTVDSANEVSGAPWQAGVSVPAGGTIQVSESHEVGYSWTIGGDLGIGAGDIVTAGAGFGFSVSESVSDAVEEAGSLPCPEGPWRCGLVVTPGMVEYHGHLHEEMGNDEGCGTPPLNSWDNEGVSDNDPFVIQLPKKDPQGNGYFTVDVCVCDNLDGWDAEGHPEILCPEDCVTGA